VSRTGTAAAYALVMVLTVELAVWGSFLTAARPFGQPLPVAAVVALVGNVGVGVAGARVLGRRTGAVLPGVVWLAIALVLGTSRTEGDLVVTSGLRGLAFLFVGTLAAAAVIGVTGARATPGAPAGR
jgi:hypothetical protein